MTWNSLGACPSPYFGLLGGLAVSLVAIGASEGVGAEFDWPQWRGPDRTGVSAETGLLRAWPDGGPRRVWLSSECGGGYSGPAIANGLLVTLGAIGDSEYLIGFDVLTGARKWSAEVGPKLENRWGDGPRGTPSLDGEFVYALSASGHLVCARTNQGTIVWRCKMSDFGGEVPDWGYTESPLVDGDRVLCTPGGPQGAVLALDKKTGAVVWQSQDFTDGAQYASLIVASHRGHREYIQLTQQHVVGLDAASGAVLWTTDWPGQTAVIPTPIYADDKVYLTSGYGAGCKLIGLGEGHQVTTLYENKNMKNHHGGVVRVGDHLYGYSDSIGWVCQHLLTGDLVWRERDALEKGSLTCADGMLVCLGESEGAVVLAEATPQGWRETGRFTLQSQSEHRSPSGGIWTHPVVANGMLFLRDQEQLSCFDVSGR